ncbi:Abi family protein [Limosilactobacillus sp. RRLNB_1_1]|uniref:Abi family protein n=1 Tax=Limosilactobacillus albertensis TaxID=2759752 RepID=A0A7W3TPV4_9LACO|nr:Abi family protein [Limosilactobacillus albertensis]MBB1068700.1 Abi family protein [Limosilactobacillus albertensis]MCD7118295.1 Abi family protein [Limosilactobacillus albertensis]MCD7129207.1 Abi family protein [Limosilactobacillus albertensis]
MSKPMMNSSQLVKHMQEKGIKFEIASPKDARYMLDNTNYYFKLASYRVNFPKDSKGRYINLDFAYLTDLASIDMQLRDYLLDLSLDIEHGIKVILLHQIVNDPKEDGYTIVREFKDKFPKYYDRAFDAFKNNRYEKDMFHKYHEVIPVWVFMEIITFGTLLRFVDFYYKKTHYKRIKPIFNHLKYSKHIRNACAHSNPLLLNLFSSKEFLPHPSDPVKAAARLMKVSNSYLQDLKINDLVSLFYLHKIIESKKMSEHRIRQGNRLVERFHRHEEWYADNTKLNTFFSILIQMIDYLNIQ